MSTPGSNLFRQASRLIKPTEIQYLKATGRTQNAARQWIPAFAVAIPLMASVQAVPRSKYAQYGLELQKLYVNVYVDYDMTDLQRDTSGDRFIWNGGLYQVNSNTDWFFQDGWSKCVAVYLNKAVS